MIIIIMIINDYNIFILTLNLKKVIKLNHNDNVILNIIVSIIVIPIILLLILIIIIIIKFNQ